MPCARSPAVCPLIAVSSDTHLHGHGSFFAVRRPSLPHGKGVCSDGRMMPGSQVGSFAVRLRMAKRGKMSFDVRLRMAKRGKMSFAVRGCTAKAPFHFYLFVFN